MRSRPSRRVAIQPSRSRHAQAALASADAGAPTVEDAVQQYIELHARPNNRSWRDTARRLGLKPDPADGNRLIKTGNGVVSLWGGRLVKDITRSDVKARLTTIKKAAHPVSANLELATLRAFFGWCMEVEQEFITVNPCANFKAPSPTVSRDRVLSDDELTQVWNAAEKIDWPFGRLVQLLILTGQRRDEVARMRWSEIDENAKAWTIPATRRKNAKDQIVPLSEAALEIIRKLPRIKSSAGFVFTTTGTSPISGYSKYKIRLDDSIRKDDGEVAPWRLHDLRRTLATGLQRLGVRLEVTESVLGHVSGSRSGIVGIYQRHEWGPEKRAALDAWAAHVVALTTCEEDGQGNVVYMQAARP